MTNIHEFIIKLMKSLWVSKYAAFPARVHLPDNHKIIQGTTHKNDNFGQIIAFCFEVESRLSNGSVLAVKNI